MGKSWEDLIDMVHAFDTLERLDDKSREKLLGKEKFKDFVVSALAIMDEEVEAKRKNAGKKGTTDAAPRARYGKRRAV